MILVPEFDLIATATFGLESLVRFELQDLGYEARVVSPGRVLFRGDESAIREANLWLRTAERVLVRIVKAETTDFDQLFELAKTAPWSEWIPPNGAFPVRGRSLKSQLTSVPACQRTVKKGIVEALLEQHQVDLLPETLPEYPIEVALLENQASLLLDTTGVGLHKRGYRRYVGDAPLRETLAAAMVSLSRWKPGQPFWDPFCGTGTLAIEAALMGRGLPPGLNREFLCERWERTAGEAWDQLREVARSNALPSLPEPLLATDTSEEALKLARRHADAAGVRDDIHFQQRDFQDLLSKRQYGCLITNPPYGERLGEVEEIERLYQSMPEVFRRLKTWSQYVLTARNDLEHLVGQQANKRRKLFNGQLSCTLFQFHGPRKPKEGTKGPDSQNEATEGEETPERFQSDVPPPPPMPAFGGLRPEAKRQAEEFASRLRKRARHLRRWPTKRGITCYRLYDRDIPEVPVVVDRYETALHVTEYERPHERTPAEHADWLDLMVRTVAEALDTPRERVYLKRRERQRGDTQYNRVADDRHVHLVKEGGLTFRVNLSDYVDTGLFLDHRQTRDMVRKAARDKRFLNLFAYTGSFTVYAADGGAKQTTTVDLSANYLEWTEANLRLNKFEAGPQHQVIRADGREFVEGLPIEPLYDLAVVDPPTFSNSKRLDDDWDIQRDAVPLLSALAKRMSIGGEVFFSTNFRRFKLDETALTEYSVREISRKTVPEDFRNQRIHRCWHLVRE